MRLPQFLIGPSRDLSGRCRLRRQQRMLRSQSLPLLRPTSRFPSRQRRRHLFKAQRERRSLVQATGTNGFVSPVSVDITGLPDGRDGEAGIADADSGHCAERDVERGRSATSGNSTVTFTGTAGTLSHAATVALTVQTIGRFQM